MAGPKKASDGMSPDDARAFVALYRLLTEESPAIPPAERRTLRAVIEAGRVRKLFTVEYPAMLARLTRVYDQVWPGRPNWKGSGLDELFREPQPGRGVEPTQKAHVLYTHLRNLVTACDQFLPAVRNELKGLSRTRTLPTVRVGCPHSIALRVLSAALTGWRRVLGQRLELELVIANSSDVIRQLNAAVLDCVVAYGELKAHSVHREGENPLEYQPLRRGPAAGDFGGPAYLSRLVLISHPDQPVRLKDGGDANDGYWERAYRDRQAPDGSRQQDLTRVPEYDLLAPISLESLDVAENQFVEVVTWKPPQVVERFYRQLRRRKEPRLVQWHEEALALARAGFGLAVVSEGTARRRGITAFKLTPAGSTEDTGGVFARAIGVYRRLGEKPSPEVDLLVDFFQRFLAEFGPDVRDIKAPRYGDNRLEQFYRDFCSDNDLPEPRVGSGDGMSAY